MTPETDSRISNGNINPPCKIWHDICHLIIPKSRRQNTRLQISKTLIPSFVIVRIQRLEGKQCRPRWGGSLSVHVIVTYEWIIFVQWGNVDSGPRFFYSYHILGLKLVLANIIPYTLFKWIKRHFRMCCIKYVTKSFYITNKGVNL